MNHWFCSIIGPGRVAHPEARLRAWLSCRAARHAHRSALGDTYGVDIADGEDDILILASTVVILMVCHGDDKRSGH